MIGRFLIRYVIGLTAPPLQASATNKKKALAWWDIPEAKITPEMEADLKMLSLRNYVDPKHHYKTPKRDKLPTNFYVSSIMKSFESIFHLF